MILAIDIGNTNTHLGFYADGKFIANETIPNTSLNKRFLEKVIKINGGKKIISVVQNVLLCSTCPKMDPIIIEWSKKVFKIKPLRAGEDFSIPIINRTTEPERVGKDRLLNALAAYQITAGKYPRSFIIVIDSGTAITFDVVSNNGEFLGGIIAPGFPVLAKSLTRNCVLLPTIIMPKQKPMIIGKNTNSAMASGIYYGTIGLVKNIIQELVSNVRIKSPKLRIILTGGDSKSIKSKIPFKSKIVLHLTLKGLVWAYLGAHKKK